MVLKLLVSVFPCSFVSKVSFPSHNFIQFIFQEQLYLMEFFINYSNEITSTQYIITTKLKFYLRKVLTNAVQCISTGCCLVPKHFTLKSQNFPLVKNQCNKRKPYFCGQHRLGGHLPLEGHCTHSHRVSFRPWAGTKLPDTHAC